MWKRPLSMCCSVRTMSSLSIDVSSGTGPTVREGSTPHVCGALPDGRASAPNRPVHVCPKSLCQNLINRRGRRDAGAGSGGLNSQRLTQFGNLLVQIFQKSCLVGIQRQRYQWGRRGKPSPQPPLKGEELRTVFGASRRSYAWYFMLTGQSDCGIQSS